MGLITKVKSTVESLLGGETFPYRCADCGIEFESAEEQTIGLECPECDSGDVRPDLDV